MPEETHSIRLHSQPPADSKSRELLLKAWIFRFCLNAGVTATPEQVSALTALWTEAFGDLSNERLEAAFRKTLAACKFWPIKVADVRGHVEDLGKKEFSLKAEAAWQQLLDWVRVHYHPNLGIDRRAPQLDAATWHSAKAAGGIRLLYSCASEDLVWRKKEFIAYYTSVHETGKAEYLLTDAESRKLLAEIRSGGPAPTKLLKEDTRRVEFAHAPPKPAQVRREFAPKSAGEQLEEMKVRGWIK